MTPTRIAPRRTFHQTGCMSSTGWDVLGLVVFVVAVSALGAFVTFGPRRRRLYHRLFPRRAALDKGASFLWPLVPIAMFLETQYSTSVSTPSGPHFDWWRTIPGVLCLIVYVAVLSILTLEARRAKEPTYWHWTHQVPARPDLAS